MIQKNQTITDLPIVVGTSKAGDYQAEAFTMDYLGINIVNYNGDSPEDAVYYLLIGLAAIGVKFNSYHIEEEE